MGSCGRWKTPNSAIPVRPCCMRMTQRTSPRNSTTRQPEFGSRQPRHGSEVHGAHGRQRQGFCRHAEPIERVRTLESTDTRFDRGNAREPIRSERRNPAVCCDGHLQRFEHAGHIRLRQPGLPSNTAAATVARWRLGHGCGHGQQHRSRRRLIPFPARPLLTVTPPALVSIAVTPANPSIFSNVAQQFTATGTLHG